jgi:hypothetical protein
MEMAVLINWEMTPSGVAQEQKSIGSNPGRMLC